LNTFFTFVRNQHQTINLMFTQITAFVQPFVVAIILLIYIKYRFKINSWKLIFKALLFGIGTIFFMLIFDLIASQMGYDMLGNLKRSTFYSFVVIGFGAEVGKFILLRYYFLRQRTFKGPLDGIIYSMLISLGFTMIALPLFTLGIFSRAVDPQILYTYTIANMAFAVVLGFFTGMGKFRKNRFIDSMTGLGAASFFHGFYYFINLTDEFLIFSLYGFGLIMIALLFIVKAVNLEKNDGTPQL